MFVVRGYVESCLLLLVKISKSVDSELAPRAEGHDNINNTPPKKKLEQRPEITFHPK